MHAVILAGGKGVRLRTYTTALPKPLVPIGEQHAILEIVMRQLSAAGFTSCTLAIGHLGHLGHIIRAYVGDGAQWGLCVDYTTEDSPLGFDELVLDLLAAETPPHAYEFDGYWLDIGRPDDYDRANAEFDARRGMLIKGV
ncbi:nucleotidyltransferase family protein [Streptomyces cucumeris]|uniref:nucleotidyltransferase family protein n=1 Tax=Streptomyces cucumeris TaxID=2962890 RepID=UPI003EBCF039